MRGKNRSDLDLERRSIPQQMPAAHRTGQRAPQMRRRRRWSQECLALSYALPRNRSSPSPAVLMPLELRGTQATGGLRSSDRVQRTLMIHARRSAFPGECAKRPQWNRTAPKSSSPSHLRAIRRRARYDPLLCDALHSFLSDPSGTRGHNARRHEAATRWKEASCRKDLEVGIARLQRLIVERALDISILSESDEYSGTPQDLRSSSGAKSG